MCQREYLKFLVEDSILYHMKDTTQYIHRVSSLDEALELAWKWKKDRKHDVFRGQSRTWPILSTLHRQKKGNYKAIREQLDRFIYFLLNNETLSHYLKDVHAVFAIAQHYGLPTNYVDFSFNPDIAAFFATHSTKNKKGLNAEIVCCNTEDFKEFVEFYRSTLFTENPIPEFIKIDVSNLWRLQSQEGCFLFTPFGGLEHYYTFDRIVFPFEQKYDTVQLDKIYPTHQSQLEQYLSHFFMHEKIVEWHVNVKKLLPDIKWEHLPEHNISVYLSIRAKHHKSWSSHNIKEWKLPKAEFWEAVQSDQTIELIIDNKKTYDDNESELYGQLIKCFDVDLLDRHFLYDFYVTRVKRPIAKEAKFALEHGLRTLWNGLRLLPYSDKQVARCLSRYVVLFLSHYNQDRKDHFTLIPHSVYIEMSSGDGSHTRAHVCGYKILESLRNDVNIIINKKYKEKLSNNPLALVQCINEPKFLFDFKQLCTLFIEDIIPTQLVLRGKDYSYPIYYHPANIEILGLA